MLNIPSSIYVREGLKDDAQKFSYLYFEYNLKSLKFYQDFFGV